MRTIKYALLCCSLVAPAMAYAQAAHPDFSGSYALDVAASEQSPLVPQKMTYVVTQTGTSMQVERAMVNAAGETTAKIRYTTDGKPSQNEYNTGPGMMHVTTIVTWEGASPVFTNDTDTGIHQVDKWTLLEGGKKLQIARTIKVGENGASATMVLVRQ
ncbi:MAG: hypothetical protein JWM95_4855 [Gemmatimonadetes bacterium]|nr:hypothetical protein [Gemmatimonadota bacterium]